MNNRYTNRTVEWGNWGITFMDIQQDTTKNFGVIVGHLSFPVGTRGPCDINKQYYNNLCKNWIEFAALPKDVYMKKP